MKTAVIGLGLIGGSMAIDLRRAGVATHITGIDRDAAHREQALALGLADNVTDSLDAIGDADLVLLAIPVNAIASILPQVLEKTGPGTVVIDAGSTKKQVCQAVAGLPGRGKFVAAHPIAGTENSGPAAAFSGLFAGKTNIICDREQSAEPAVATALQVFDALGLRSIFMNAEDHDRHVAYVSHLSHVSAFLLGQTVLDIEKDEKNIFNLAGSGFASTVRLAKSSPDMWAPIFDQNSEFLSQALQEYIMHLQRFHYLLMKHDQEGLRKIMNGANDIRRVLEGIELKQGRPVTVETTNKNQ
ncbi:MAG: prephenate dehydrogenase [Bacteroidota bacterium]